MSDRRLAIVTTTRPWAATWSHHFRDHGPWDVIGMVAERRMLFDADWQLLLVDADSPLLDEKMIQAARLRRRGVVVVVDVDEPRAKQRAAELRPHGLIETDASPAEVDRVLSAVLHELPAIVRQGALRAPTRSARTSRVIAVGGDSGWVPAVALGLATQLGRRHPVTDAGPATILVDADELHPAIGTLLDMDPMPNLVSAVADVRAGREVAAVRVTARAPFGVIAGLADPSQWMTVAAAPVWRVIAGLDAERIVAVVGSVLEDLHRTAGRFAVSLGVLAEADVVVAVADSTAVGITRLARWVEGLPRIAPDKPLHVVLANPARDAFRRRELLEVASTFRPAGLWFAAADHRRRDRAEWQGRLVKRSRLVSSLAPLATELDR